MNLDQLIDFLGNDSEFQKNLTKWMVLDSKEAVHADFPENLDPRLKNALQKKNITQQPE